MVEDEGQQRTSGLPASAPSGDLEYDEAHEALAGAGRTARSHQPVEVATQSDDGAGGDYAYDLAHDVPRSSGSSGAGTR